MNRVSINNELRTVRECACCLEPARASHGPVLTRDLDGDTGCANRTSSNGQRPEAASQAICPASGEDDVARQRNKDAHAPRAWCGMEGGAAAAAAALGCALRSPSPSSSLTTQWTPLLRHRPPGAPRFLFLPARRFR
jgi:hypothetical protein